MAEFKGESVGSTVTRDLSAIAYMTQWHTVLACFAAEQYAQTHLCARLPRHPAYLSRG